MARRTSLIGSMVAARTQAEASADADSTKAPGGRNQGSREMVTTAVHIPKEDHSLLRRVAVERANLQGGRPSVSAVLSSLVERHRAELEKEAQGGR